MAKKKPKKPRFDLATMNMVYYPPGGTKGACFFIIHAQKTVNRKGKLLKKYWWVTEHNRRNHQVVWTTETYTSKPPAKKAARDRAYMLNAPVYDYDEPDIGPQKGNGAAPVLTG